MIEFRITDIKSTIDSFEQERNDLTKMAKNTSNECSSVKNALSDTINRVTNDIRVCQNEESQAKTVCEENEALKSKLLSQKAQISQNIASNNAQIAKLNTLKSAAARAEKEQNGKGGGDSSSQASQIQSQISQLQSENSKLSASLQDIERKISIINANNARLNTIIGECHKQIAALKSHLEKLKAKREHLINTHYTLSFEYKQLGMVLNNVIKTAEDKLDYATQFVGCFEFVYFGGDNGVTISSVSELSNSLHNTIMRIHQTEQENNKLMRMREEALKLFTANSMRENAKNIERAVQYSNECLDTLRSLTDKLGKAIEFLKKYEQ